MTPTRSLHAGPRGVRRIIGALFLLIFMISGPAHVWHHHGPVDGGSPAGESDHQCLPCLAFSHLWFVGESPEQVATVLVRIAPAAVSDAGAPAAIVARTDPSRAPPA